MGVAPVTDAAIDAYLRDEASSSLSSDAATNSTTTTTTTTPSDIAPTTTPTTTAPTISDAEFNKWFKQQLDNTGLSVKEYREVASVKYCANGLPIFFSGYSIHDAPGTPLGNWL